MSHPIDTDPLQHDFHVCDSLSEHDFEIFECSAEGVEFQIAVAQSFFITPLVLWYTQAELHI